MTSRDVAEDVADAGASHRSSEISLQAGWCGRISVTAATSLGAMRHLGVALTVAVPGVLLAASTAAAFGKGNAAWNAYYNEPGNESTWEPFCEGGGGHVKAHGDGVMACGPTNEGNEIEIPGPGLTKGISTPGFQCVELSERFLYITHGWGTIGANGAQVAERYASAQGVPLIANGTAGVAPHIGDVMSFSNENFANPKEAGHTGVVIASNVDSGGNGTITLLSENISGDGNESTFAVTGWKVASVFSFKASEWVQSGGGGGPLEITTKELPVGTPGKYYAASLNVTGGAGGDTWSLSSGALQAGLSLAPSGQIAGVPKWPGVVSVSVRVTDSQGHSQSAVLVLKVGAQHEELFARASDGSVWHDYFIPGSSSWSGWGSLAGASGVTLRSDVSTSESATPLAALGSGPTVMTGAATAASPVAEELAGSVNPNGETVSECRFEYGSTASYGDRPPFGGPDAMRVLVSVGPACWCW
jgi:hypothetical protein